MYTQSIAFEWVCETTDVKGQVQKYPVVSQNKSYITLQFGSCSHPFFASSRVSYVLSQKGQNILDSLIHPPI